MMTDGATTPTGGHLPTLPQMRLLKTILGPEDQLVANWQAWQEQVALDDIDHGSFRLLSMLHHVLRRQGIEGKDMNRYHGVARKVWYQNRLTFHRVEALIKTWQAEGREIAVLKGVPLAHLYYPDPALRPMDDADILVPQAEAIPAIDWFFNHGWHHMRHKSRDEVINYLLRKDHSVDMCHENGYTMDVHWQILHFPLPPGVMSDIWNAMVPVKINGVVTRTLGCTDQLLHTCAHGNAWNVVPPLRWIVDAHLILKKEGDLIDWGRLVNLTSELQIGLFISTSLRFLRDEFGQPIPDEVLTQLEQLPRPRWQVEEYQAYISSNPLAMRDHSLRNRYKRLRVTLPEWQRKSKWQAQLDYAKLHWEVDSTPKILSIVGHRVARRLGYKLRGLFGQ